MVIRDDQLLLLEREMLIFPCSFLIAAAIREQTPSLTPAVSYTGLIFHLAECFTFGDLSLSKPSSVTATHYGKLKGSNQGK